MTEQVDKSPGRIRAMFEEIAPTYDFLNRMLSFRRDVTWRKRAAEIALPDGPGTALDVCTGTADLALALAERGAKVVGSDFAPRMLELGSRKLGASPVTLAAADTLRLPFPDSTFDACTVAFGLRNTKSPVQALAEMGRVVRPGGRVVVLEFIRPPNPLVRFYVERLLPVVGDLVSGSRQRAYSYLPRSVGQWFRPDELSSLMASAGLKDPACHPLSPAIAAIHVATK